MYYNHDDHDDHDGLVHWSDDSPKTIGAVEADTETSLVKSKPAYASYGTGFVTTYAKHEHQALTPIEIGGKSVWLGAHRDIPEKIAESMDLIIPLNGDMPKATPGKLLTVLSCSLPDMGGVPNNWKEIIDYVADLVRRDYKVLAYCMGGHGRTGTFGASLIAVMEGEEVDPFTAIRERHCNQAVESSGQLKAIYALRGQKPPKEHTKKLKFGGTSTIGWEATAGHGAIPASDAVAQALRSAREDGRIKGWNMPYGSHGLVRIWITGAPEDDENVVQDKVLAFLSDLREKPSTHNPTATPTKSVA